jgi:hypothetical protein
VIEMREAHQGEAAVLGELPKHPGERHRIRSTRQSDDNPAAGGQKPVPPDGAANLLKYGAMCNAHGAKLAAQRERNTPRCSCCVP